MDDKSHPPRYTIEEVNHIIRRALKLNATESISHEDLLETAG
jgi:hypothetical protein